MTTTLPWRPLAAVLVLATALHGTWALENGLARTPPMGWMNWQRFRCNIDCVNDPANCISERLFTDMADMLVADGYRDAGYDLVAIDDCWSEMERDAAGNLVADHERFPHGIAWLSDYMHRRGLRLAIYADVGNYTCAGWPGSQYHMEQDAQTFAAWRVDALKFDGCYMRTEDLHDGYVAMGQHLLATGRPIQYGCGWPLFDPNADVSVVPEHCNLWRLFHDIEDSWVSTLSIIDQVYERSATLQPLARPGAWNDPDMLIIGDFGLSYEQSKTQMALWAIFAGPLYMSNDLRDMRPWQLDLLINPKVIAVNQDPLGIQGSPVFKRSSASGEGRVRPLQPRARGGLEAWSRPIVPEGSRAVVIFNRDDQGTPQHYAAPLRELGLTDERGYDVEELFLDWDFGHMLPDDTFACTVNVTGVVMVTAKIHAEY